VCCAGSKRGKGARTPVPEPDVRPGGRHEARRERKGVREGSARSEGPRAQPARSTAPPARSEPQLSNQQTQSLLARAPPAAVRGVTLGATGDAVEQAADRLAHTGARATQGAGATHATAGAGMPAAIQALGLGGGMALPPQARRSHEAMLGTNLAAVRVHTGSTVDAWAERLGARGFSMGGHVALASRHASMHADNPVLRHELAHVLLRQRGLDPEPQALRRDPDPHAAGMTSGRAPASVVAPTPMQSSAPAPTATQTLPPGKHAGATVGAWGVVHGLQMLVAGPRVMRDFGSFDEASAYARGMGTAGVIFEEDALFIVYTLQGAQGFTTAATRIHYSGNISNLRAQPGVLAFVTEDGMSISPRFARTPSGYEPNYDAWMEQADRRGATADPFSGHKEAFGTGLAGISDRTHLLRQFEVAMRDTAYVVLDQSEQEARTKWRQLQGGVPEADRETLQRVATEVADLDQKIAAANSRATITQMGYDPKDTAHNKRSVTEEAAAARAESEQLTAQKKEKLLAYPLLSQVDAADFLKLDDKQRARELGDRALEVQLNIESTRQMVARGNLSLWSLAPLVAAAKQGLGITGGDAQRWIDDEVSTRRTWDVALQVAMVVLQIGLTAGATLVGGPVGAAMAVGALGVGVVDAVLATDRYLTSRTTSNTDINRNEGLMPADISGDWAWVVVAWVGVGLSFADAVKAVRLARVANASDAALMQIAKEYKVDIELLRGAYAKSLLGKAKPDPVALQGILRSSMDEATLAKFGDTPVQVLSSADFTKLLGSQTGEAAVVFNRAAQGEARAVVYFREGANPMVLREEAVHLAQALDPENAAKIKALRQISEPQWRRMSLQQRLSSYRTKLQLEIDAQSKVIARGGEAEYLEDLAEHLKTMEQRLGETDALLADAERLKSGTHPEWLQPGDFDKATTLFAKPRLPRAGGTWIEGTRGNGLWMPDQGTPAYAATGGEAVRFRNNYPVFARWSKARVSITMSGEGDDFARANQELARRNGWLKGDGTPNAAEAQRWMDANDLTWHHHQGGKSMMAVPTEIHANIPHTGGASAARSN
jgi:hypothetical protein